MLQRGGGDGIQPERLNAEGEARELLAGLSVTATPGAVWPLWKKDANVVAKEAVFRVFRIMVGLNDTEGYASLHPRLRVTRSARVFELAHDEYIGGSL